MRFFSLFSKVLLLSALFLGVTTAATGDIWSRMDNLSSGIPFWYTSQKISITQVSTTGLTLSSPKIQDELGNDIKKYTVMYSQYPLSDILENTALLDQSKEKTFEFATVGTTITMALTAAVDIIDPSKVYYISVIPKDQNSILWEISNELRFKLADRTRGEWLYTWWVHAAAGADMNLASVSHINTGGRVTLRWIAVNGSDSVDILLLDAGATTFTKLATVSMSAEKYEFTVTRNGEFTVNFLPNNSGREKRYTFTIVGVTPGVTTGVVPVVIKKVPKVWPAENVLVALFIAFVLYLLYRRNTVKSR